MAYQAESRLEDGSWVTSLTVPDPINIPDPLGWNILVRPIPIKQDIKPTNTSGATLYIPQSATDQLVNTLNIGVVTKIGPCCWSRPQHKNKDGSQFDWVKVGDIVSYPKNTGLRRKFKGVSFVLLQDDDVIEKFSDIDIFDKFFELDIPEDWRK